MAGKTGFPLNFPAAHFSQEGDIPLAAEQLLAEVLPLLLAKQILEPHAFPRDPWFGTVHKLTLPPHVVEAFRLLGVKASQETVSLSALASRLSARVQELSLAYLSARAAGLDLSRGFYVVHTDYLRPIVRFWSEVLAAELSRGQLVFTGWPVRLRSDGTLGSSGNYEELRRLRFF